MGNEKVIAIIAIAVLGCVALFFKLDGMIVATAIAAIAGLAGFSQLGKPPST